MIPPVYFLLSFLHCIATGIGLLLLWNAWNDRPVAVKQQLSVGAIHILLLYGYRLLFTVSFDNYRFSSFLNMLTALTNEMYDIFSVQAFYPFELTLFILVIFWGFRQVPFADRCWTAILSYCSYEVLYLTVGAIMPQTLSPLLTVQLTLLAIAGLFLFLSKRFQFAAWSRRHALTLRIVCVALLVPSILWTLLSLIICILNPGDANNFGVLYAVPFVLLIVILLFSLIVSRISQREKQKSMQKSTTDHMADLNRLIDESRQNIHDFNKHIRYLCNTVNIHCEQGDVVALQEQVNAYCKELLDRSEKDEIVLHLDDPTLRALLYGRRTEAKAADIDFILDASGLLPHFPVKNYQMVEIFDNLMDNAFDGVKTVDTHRFIRVILDCEPIDEKRYRHTLCIQNPHATPTIDGLLAGKPFTTKGGKHQGIGLTKVSRLVADTGGKLILGQDENLFSVKVVYEEA